MKKIIVMVLIAFVLMGCTGAKVETKEFEGKLNGVDIKVSIEHKDDKVLKQTSHSTMNFKELGLEKENIETLVNTYKNMYDIKGVNYEAEIKEESAIEKIEINYEEADLNKLIEVGLLMSKKDGTIKFVSYEETVKNLETSGVMLKK